MKSIAVLICTCLFWVGLTCVPSPAGQFIFQSYNKPVPLPQFSLENLAGKSVSIRDYRGQVLLLNFCATWCTACRKEDPSLEKLFTQYSSKGLVLFFIIPKENKETIQKFMEKESLHMPVLLDETGKVGRLFGVWAQPTSYLIDCHGIVRYRVMGAVDWTGLEATSVIDHLLQEN